VDEPEVSAARRYALTAELRRVLAESNLDMLDVAGCIAEALSYEPGVRHSSSGPSPLCTHTRPCGVCVTIHATR
jgi:hypothetical protein